MPNLVIAFSGGCFSGKTTTINLLKEKLGDSCIILDEIIREIFKKDDTFSIEEIRKNPKEYFNLQKKIITQKIISEKEIITRFDNKIILIDRALTDSLFYLSHYVNTNSDEIDKHEYITFYKFVQENCKEHFKNIYDVVLEFKPIESVQNDDFKFRPKDVDKYKYIEYFHIHSFNKSFKKYNKTLIKINLNKGNFYECFIKKFKKGYKSINVPFFKNQLLNTIFR